MSVENKALTDTPDTQTPTKSPVLAVFHHVAKGVDAAIDDLGIIGIAVVGSASVVVGAAIGGHGVNATFATAVIVIYANIVCGLTENHANDISPKLATTLHKISPYALCILPLAIAAIFNQVAPQTSVTTQSYKVSGSANDNCQLTEIPSPTAAKRVFELPKNCEFKVK